MHHIAFEMNIKLRVFEVLIGLHSKVAKYVEIKETCLRMKKVSDLKYSSSSNNLLKKRIAPAQSYEKIQVVLVQRVFIDH